MKFTAFAQRWIEDNIQNRNIRDFVRDMTDLINSWDLTGTELSLYTGYLFQLIKAWNEYKEYD